MKKVFLLLTLIATTFSAWGEIKVDSLFLAGACTQGTTWGDGGRLKLNQNGSVYTYIGYFYGSTSEGFKMPTSHCNNTTCVRPKSNSSSAVTIEATRGNSYAIVKSNSPDHKFRVSQNGWYSFTIDLANEKFSVASSTYPSVIYALGSATTYGWGFTKAMNETSAGSGKYEGYVDFKSGKNEMKFACMYGNDKTMIGAANQTDTIKGTGTFNAKHYNVYAKQGSYNSKNEVNYSQNDKKFRVYLGSNVTYYVKVDLTNTSNNFTVTIKQKPTFTIDKTAVTGKVGSTFTRTFTTNSGGTKSYTSSNTKVATVDNSGNVTFVGAGTATITAKVAESTTFGPMSDSYTVTVERYLPELAFAEASKTVCKNAAAFINPLQNKGNGAVEYSGGSESVATIAADGTITIKGAGGPITFTATSVQTDQYSSGSTTFTLTVTDNLTPCPVAPVDITEIKDVPSLAVQYGWSQQTQNPFNLNNAISFATVGGNAKYLNNTKDTPAGTDNNMRYYMGTDSGKIIVNAAKTGVIIKSVKFDYGSINNGVITSKRENGKSIISAYRLNSGDTKIVNANTVTYYTGETDIDGNGQVRITKYTVAYSDPTIVLEQFTAYPTDGGNHSITGDNGIYKWKINAQDRKQPVGTYYTNCIKLQYEDTIASDGVLEGGIKSVSFDWRPTGADFPNHFIVKAGTITDDFQPGNYNDYNRILTYSKDFEIKSNVALSIYNPSEESPKRQNYPAIGPVHITPYLLFNVANHTASLDVKDGTTCDLNSALINNTNGGTIVFSILENTAGGYPTLSNGILDFSSVTEEGYIKVQAKWGDVTTTLKLNITPLPKQVLSFAESSKNVTLGAAPFENELTHSTGDGEVTYESSNPSVATVVDGTVTVHAVGAAMIIAKAAKTDKYQAAEKSYAVNVARVSLAVPLADITETKQTIELANDLGWEKGQHKYSFDFNNAITITATDGSENAEVVGNYMGGLRYYQEKSKGQMNFEGKTGVTIKSVKVNYSGWNDHTLAMEYIGNGCNVPTDKRVDSAAVLQVNANTYSLYTGSTSFKTQARLDISKYTIIYNDPFIVFEQLQGYTSGISADVTGDNGLYKWSVNAVDRTESVGAYKGVKLQDANKSIAMLENQEGGIKSVSFDYKVLSTDAIGFNVTAGGVTDEYTHAGVTANRVLTYTHDFDAQNTSLKIELTAGKSAIAVGPIHITPYLLFNVEGHAVTINLTSADDATSIDLMPLLINNTGTAPSFTMLEYTTGGNPSVSDAGVVDFSSVTKTGTIKVRANVGSVTTTLTLTINLKDPKAKFAKETDAIYTTAGTYKQTLENESTGKVTYSLTSAPAGAAINETTGEVTISATADTYTVQGKLAAALPYAEAVKTYTLTVTEPPVPSTSFAFATINKNQLDTPFTNKLTTQSDGKKHFTSTDTRVAMVNDSTGEVTMGEKPGTTKIEVTIDATKSWKQGYAEYTLNVSGAPLADANVLTISTDDLKKKHGFENDHNYTNIALNDVLTLNKGKYYTDDGGVLRYYQKHDNPKSFTIQAKAGVIIQTVKFTYISRNSGTLAKKTGTSIGASDRYVSGTTYTVDANSFTCYYGNTGTGDDGRADITEFEIKYFAPSEGVAVTKSVADLGKGLHLTSGKDYMRIDLNNVVSLKATKTGTLKYWSSGNINCYRDNGPIDIIAREGAKIHYIKITYQGKNDGILTKYWGTNGKSIPGYDRIASDSIIYVNANSVRLHVGTTTNTTNNGSIEITKIYVNYSDTTSSVEIFDNCTETNPDASATIDVPGIDGAYNWKITNFNRDATHRIYYDQSIMLRTQYGTTSKIETVNAEGGIKEASFDWFVSDKSKRSKFTVKAGDMTEDVDSAAMSTGSYKITYTKKFELKENGDFSITMARGFDTYTYVEFGHISLTPYLLYKEKTHEIKICDKYTNTNLIDNRDNTTAIVYSVTKGNEYASVDAVTGEVTGLKAGTATIQAAWDGVTTTYTLTVSAESSITLDEEKDNSLLIAGYDGIENMNVTLKRKLSAGKYNTFCVPFEISKDALAEALETEITQLITLDESQPGALEEEGGQMNLNIAMKEVETIEAGKPYLLEIADDVTDSIEIVGVTIENVGDDNYFQSKDEKVKFYGITSKYLIANDNHYLFMSNNRLSWNNSGAAAWMKGLRSYFHATNGGSGVSARLVFRQPQTPTEVDNVNANVNANRKMIINNQLIIIRDGKMYNSQGAIIK